jgi:integral membrane protein
MPAKTSSPSAPYGARRPRDHGDEPVGQRRAAGQGVGGAARVAHDREPVDAQGLGVAAASASAAATSRPTAWGLRPASLAAGGGATMMRGVIRWFRGVAIVEAISYLVLLAASVGKHAFGDGVLVDVMGPVHGTIFLVYLGLALAIRRQVRWSWSTVGIVAVAAAIPLGALVVERRLVPAGAGDDGDPAAPATAPVAGPR